MFKGNCNKKAFIKTRLAQSVEHRATDIKVVQYKRKFSRGSNFRYFRERFENAKICLREKLYFKRKFGSRCRYDIFAYPV